MIIEKEKQVEIIEDEKKAKKESETKFKPIPTEQSSTLKHAIIATSIFLAIFLCSIIIIFGIFAIYNKKNNEVISKGIYINGIDMSNSSQEEAQNKLEKYYKDKLSRRYNLNTQQLCNLFNPS